MCIRDRRKAATTVRATPIGTPVSANPKNEGGRRNSGEGCSCLLYTSDAADERSSVDLGGRRIIKKKKKRKIHSAGKARNRIKMYMRDRDIK